jgi:hypothetical protein
MNNMELNQDVTYTAHKISDERGYYFWEIRARHGDRIEVAAVCDSAAEAKATLKAIKAATVAA